MDKKKNNSKTSTDKRTDKPTDKPTDKLADRSADIRIDRPVGPLDKSILTCSVKSIPTFCQSPHASIDCQTLLTNMNDCTALYDPTNPDEFVVYDPNNCGEGITGPIAGCGAGNNEFCRVCGRDNEPAILPCATGFYSPYYAPSSEQKKDEANKRVGVQTIDKILALPVRINCDVYFYDT
jgi:hypothetical protein